MFWLKNKKIKFELRTLIWRPSLTLNKVMLFTRSISPIFFGEIWYFYKIPQFMHLEGIHKNYAVREWLMSYMTLNEHISLQI